MGGFKLKKPLKKPVLEGVSVDTVPAVGLSENPVKTEPELSSKQSNPTPSAIFTISWYMTHSVNPNQTYAHKHRHCKKPVYDSAFSSPCLKQWKIPITSHLSLPLDLSLFSAFYDQLRIYCGGVYSTLRNLVVLPATDFVINLISLVKDDVFFRFQQKT
jgi:hypothetical protein